MAEFKSSLAKDALIHAIITLLVIVLIIYVGYSGIIEIAIIIIISVIIFLIGNYELAYNFNFVDDRLIISNTLRFWQPAKNILKISSILSVRIDTGPRHEPLIYISTEETNYRFGILGLTKSMACEIESILKEEGCKIVINIFNNP